MKFEYLTAMILEGGEANHYIAVELDRYGAAGWEFCAWVHDWEISEGPGPNRREAMFKRAVRTT